MGVTMYDREVLSSWSYHKQGGARQKVRPHKMPCTAVLEMLLAWQSELYSVAKMLLANYSVDITNDFSAYGQRNGCLLG